jgi:hypothetical protein
VYIVREVVEAQATTIDVVLQLLAERREVWRYVELVTTTAELVDVVILCREA